MNAAGITGTHLNVADVEVHKALVEMFGGTYVQKDR
jgi:hypothetical protein